MYRSWYFKKKICAQFAVLTSDKLPIGLVTSCHCKDLHILHKLLITKDTSIYYISCFSHRKVGGKNTISISEHCLKPQRTSIYRVHASWKNHKLLLDWPQIAYKLSVELVASCQYIKIKWEHLYTEYMHHVKNTHISPPLPHSAPSLLICHLSLSLSLWE